jgi:hypothetical protein
MSDVLEFIGLGVTGPGMSAEFARTSQGTVV